MSGRPSWKSAEIGLFRRFSAFFALFRRVPRAPGKTQETEERGLFPQISSDFLTPPSLKPPFAALQILLREHRFGEKNSLSLTEFWGKLGEFCEKLGEFTLSHEE